MPSVGLRATDGYLLNLRTFVGKQPSVVVFFSGPSLHGARREEVPARLRPDEEGNTAEADEEPDEPRAGHALGPAEAQREQSREERC